jgi:hypothetical protein
LLAEKPSLIQGYNFDNMDYPSFTGFLVPPILRVNGSKDLLNHLLSITDDTTDLFAISAQANVWYKANSGHAAAEKLLNLFSRSRESRLPC